KYSDATNIYKKGEGIGTPIHVRASLLYNHMVKQNGLDRKYRLIQEGDNIHFILLKVPNRLRENVIAFTAVLPHELGLNNLIDYDIMFSKTFKEPLDSLLICLKWNLEQKNTIDTLFGE
ncbi:MAG TPA: DNA polymerase, partial [Bacteroidia bacterium]